MRIGVLSDTHIPHRLPQLPLGVTDVFASATVSLVLHAGDVDDLRSLELLSQVAPVVAVRGNVHVQDFSRGGAELPSHVILTLCGRRLVVTHGHLRGVAGLGVRSIVVAALGLDLLTREQINRCIARRLHRRFPRSDIVVFGHTHRPFQTWIDGTFFFNPGAVCHENNPVPSVGILTLGCESLEAQVVPLPL